MARVGRRSALKLIGAAPLAAGFGVSSTAAQTAHQHAAPAVAKTVKGASFAPKFFNAHEWDTVRTLVDLIIPKDERSGSATDAGVPEFMDGMMLDAADGERARELRQTAMRGGLAWIDRECRTRFGQPLVKCTPAQQVEFLDGIAYWKGERGDDLEDAGPHEFHAAHGPAFFASFRDLTAAGFWSSKMGVDDIGYIGNTPTTWTGPPEAVLRKLGL